MVIFHWSFGNVSFSVIIHEQLCHVNFYGWCQIERYFHQISRNLGVGRRCPKEKTGRQRWLLFKTIIKMSKASDQILSLCFQFSKHIWRSSEHQKSKALLKAHGYQSPCPSKNENKETNSLRPPCSLVTPASPIRLCQTSLHTLCSGGLVPRKPN